MDSRKKL